MQQNLPMSVMVVEEATAWFIADTLKLVGVLTAVVRLVSFNDKEQKYKYNDTNLKDLY